MQRLLAPLLAVAALAVPASTAAEDPTFVDWSSRLAAVPSGHVPTSEDDCVAGRVRCVDQVIKELERRFAPLARSCDHDAIFALSYLRTTEEYRRTIEDPAFFEDTAFVNHEDAVFGSYYFRALDSWSRGGADTPPAWRIAFAAAERRELPASGDLSLGINAHVQRDLPFVLAGIGLVKPDGGTRKTDHDRVNRFLNRVTDGLFAEIAARFDPTIDDGNLPTMIDEVVSFQIIPTWREFAWRNAERLVNAPTPAARALVAADIEAYAASQADALRRASQYGPGESGAARAAYCAANQ